MTSFLFLQDTLTRPEPEFQSSGQPSHFLRGREIQQKEGRGLLIYAQRVPDLFGNSTCFQKLVSSSTFFFSRFLHQHFSILVLTNTFYFITNIFHFCF